MTQEGVSGSHIFNIYHVRAKQLAPPSVYPLRFVLWELWFYSPFKRWKVDGTPFLMFNTTIRPMSVAKEDQTSSADIIPRCLSFSRLVDTVAWCLRWRIKTSSVIIRLQQIEQFVKEIARLNWGLPLEMQRRLRVLHFFLEKHGSCLSRGGGPLSNVLISFRQKHLIILGKSHLTDLIIKQTLETND